MAQADEDSCAPRPGKRPRVDGANAPVVLTAAAAEDKGSRAQMEGTQLEVSESVCRRCGFLAYSDYRLEGALDRKAFVKQARTAIADGFKAADEVALAKSKEAGTQDGATCVAVWAVDDTIFIANTGDAKGVLARAPDKAADPGHFKAITLTKEHKALFAAERARIEKAGGHVSADGRLEGRIEVSRSLGDAQFKTKGLIATPDIQVFRVTARDKFLLLGCDGFFGVFAPDDAVRRTQQLMQEGRNAKATCNRLIFEAVRERC